MKKIKRIASICLIALSIFALNPISAYADWKKDSKGWWYSNGNTWYTGWKVIDGNWYYFYSNGYMAHDTIVDNCCLSSNGAWIQNTANSSYNTNSNSDWGLPNPNDYVNTFKNGDLPDYYTDPSTFSTLPKTSNTQPSGNIATSSYCDYCHGTGICPICHGSGSAIDLGGGHRNCDACGGSGKCPWCTSNK